MLGSSLAFTALLSLIAFAGALALLCHWNRRSPEAPAAETPAAEGFQAAVFKSPEVVLPPLQRGGGGASGGQRHTEHSREAERYVLAHRR